MHKSPLLLVIMQKIDLNNIFKSDNLEKSSLREKIVFERRVDQKLIIFICFEYSTDLFLFFFGFVNVYVSIKFSFLRLGFIILLYNIVNNYDVT